MREQATKQAPDLIGFVETRLFGIEQDAGLINYAVKAIQRVALHQHTRKTALGMAHDRGVRSVRVNLDFNRLHAANTSSPPTGTSACRN